MFRFAVLVGISLLVYGASSVPRSAWGKVDDTAVQETLMSAGEPKRAVGLKEEVEPPEDLDVSDVDVDASMLIWKAVQESRRHALEETRAHAAHHAHAHADGPRQPAEAQLPRAPAPGSRYQQAEPDMDEVFHNFPNRAGAAEQQEAQEEEDLEQRAETSRGRYEQAELDLDHVYHGDKGQVQVQTQVEVGQDDVSMPGHRGRSLPEEDMDDLYHKY